ncbi:MAG: hypothetical protein A2340_00365 [Lentisphaerae bacterium RIFOXYB12_FULL_60_10]|nr:MAG: hypothetical protein A2340_00365 [Lentisphaerae bacterium RIFOXYB12_FULL_60_10]
MNELKIGWASRDVSTDKPVIIPGQFHARISQGVFDPILVTALVIDNGADLVAFLSADIVVIRSFLLDRIREKVADLNPAIPVAKILFNATHTHTGPTTYGDQPSQQMGSSTASSDEFPHAGIEIASSNDYYNYFVVQAAEAIVEAYRKRTAGGVAYGYGYAVVAHSRRVVYFDDVSKRPGAVINSTHGVNGHARMYGETQDDQFSHYEAGADHFINLLYTFDAAGKLTGAIVNVPCPSQNSEGEWKLSASFWNEVREAIHAHYGNIFILPQGAAGGDLAPRILHYKKAQERRLNLKYGSEPEPISEWKARKDIAERITSAFSEVLSWAKNDIKTALPMTHVVETVQLSKRLITDEEYAYEQQQLDTLLKTEFKKDGTPRERLVHDSQLVAARNRCQRILTRYEEQAKEPKLPMELHVLRIGEIAFASNRFELYMDFMHRIQARSPFTQTFIIQLAGTPGPDGGTYLATDRGAWGKGYSASRYCNIVSPQGGQELVEDTVRLLKAIHSP